MRQNRLEVAGNLWRGLLGAVLLLNVGCGSRESVQAALPAERPPVIRSVLDERPRMLSIKLDERLWLAYSAQTCGFYKAWAGAVQLEGAVYNQRHGPQPFSVGDAWMISDINSPWAVTTDGGESRSVQYKGHSFAGDQVSLHCVVGDGAGQVFELSETPTLVRDGAGRIGLQRIYQTPPLPDGAVVSVQLQLDSLRPDGGIETDGVWQASSQAPTGGVAGSLQLNADGRTEFTAWLAEAPMLMQPAWVAHGGDQPPGLKLIEGSDCSICHNPQDKTVGPSYIAIAERYENTDAVALALAKKVMQGGSGAWGKVMMTAHPDLNSADALAMVDHILSLDGEARVAQAPDEQAAADPLPEGLLAGLPMDSAHGVVANIYVSTKKLAFMPEHAADAKPAYSVVLPQLHAMSLDEFGGLGEHFSMVVTGNLNVAQAGNFTLRLISDDGATMQLNGKQIIDNGGLHAPRPVDAEVHLGAGEHPFRIDYFQAGVGAAVSLQWLPEGATSFAPIPQEAFTFARDDLRPTEVVAVNWGAPPPGTFPSAKYVPGSGGASLVGMHPAFDVERIRPDSFKPMVGGLDVMADGRVVVSTWDETGGVYLLSNLETGDPNNVQVKLFAQGLAEPLGLKVVDDVIYVLQKHELTRLIDENRDGLADRYETVSNHWQVSDNFHEFAFGLVYADGYFYATLATAINPGGASKHPQIPDRGKALRINAASGEVEFLAHGLRTPNGIGFGVDNALFIADNQGDWLPSSKIVHLQPGAFYGSRSVDFAGTAMLAETPPVVWLPQDEIGNSPSQPAPLNVGPWAGQMMHGEVTHGGIKRVFTEKINGQYQGAVFRFMQGLEAGVNRLVVADDGRIYVGGVGNPGNWGHEGGNWFGLQRLTYNGSEVFELLAVRAMTNGMQLEFTQPLKPGDGHDPADYSVRQWRYLPTEHYGGPKIDNTALAVRTATVSPDRRRVFLELDGMRAGHVVHIDLKRHFVSAREQELWTTESWYTLNAIPAGRLGTVEPQPLRAPNALTAAEQAAGWQLLFDGKTMNGWRGFKRADVPRAWRVRDGTLAFDATDIPQEQRGDLITDEVFGNFEFRLEWKIAPAGNSGILYHVLENDDFDYIWETGPEMQVLDNYRHPDGKLRSHRAGDLYDLVESRVEAANPVGEWNEVRIIVRDGRLQHWLNGRKTVDTGIWDEQWFERIANSKFAGMPGFGRARVGHIALQDHSDPVWFRNIRIRTY